MTKRRAKWLLPILLGTAVVVVAVVAMPRLRAFLSSRGDADQDGLASDPRLSHPVRGEYRGRSVNEWLLDLGSEDQAERNSAGEAMLAFAEDTGHEAKSRALVLWHLGRKWPD